MTGTIRLLAWAAALLFELGRRAGVRRTRAEAVEFLYAQAEVHRGGPSDQKRRGTLHHAADRFRDGRGVGRAA